MNHVGFGFQEDPKKKSARRDALFFNSPDLIFYPHLKKRPVNKVQGDGKESKADVMSYRPEMDR